MADQTEKAQLEGRLRDARRRRRKAEGDLQRLRDRRSVRIVLRLAELARPLFRLVRRFRQLVRRFRQPDASPVPPSSARRTADAVAAAASTESDVSASGWTANGAVDIGPVTIIVPVHDAPDSVERCLASVVRNTTRPARLLIIDDASEQQATRDLLASFVGAGIEILRQRENLGFTETVNHGFEASDGDVVVLNSDTVVPPRWLENLVHAAYRDPSVGTVTAISDNAGAFAVPEIDEANPTPADLDTDEIGRLVLRGSERRYPSTPTANGFCMYVKRALLDEVGHFDGEAFPRGYGEENDLSLRASAAGWSHVVDDATFVFHERGASFGGEKRELAAAGRAVLDDRYPSYTDEVRAFVSSPDMLAVRARVRSLFADPPDRVRPRVLYAVHAGGGGTAGTTRDLMAGVVDEWEAFLLLSDAEQLRIERFTAGGGLETVRSAALEQPLQFPAISDPAYRELVGSWLLELGIELVHVRHLLHHTLDLPGLARELSIPVVVSVHDYYLACPTIHLVDDRGRFCEGVCTPGQGTCPTLTPWIEATTPHLKHQWVHEWQRLIEERVISQADALVTTAEGPRDLIRNVLPAARERPFELIPHGRDLEQRNIAVRPRPDEPLRVVISGSLDIHKGAETWRRVKQLDVDDRIELHLYGGVRSHYRDLGTYHGTYERERLADVIAGVAPSVAAILTLNGETFCHSLTEAWAAGLPVVVADRGALRERVERHGGGWMVDPTDANAVLSLLVGITEEPQMWDRIAAVANLAEHDTVAEMGRAYVALYARVLSARRAFRRA